MNVAVVGAGVGGLTAAYDLAKAGHQVTILEAESFVGGLSAGFKIPRWEWSLERYYRHWFATDRHILGLIEELGLGHRVIFPRPTTAVFHQGKFYALDSPMAVLAFPGLTIAQRIRLGAVVGYLRYLARWKPLESYTADAWMRRWLGEAAYTALWEPLLVGKFGPYYRDVNMAWMWARFKARTPRLGTFEGGFQAFFDTFADHVQAMGVDIRLRTPVQCIEPSPQGGLKILVSEGILEVDQCLATTSPTALVELAPSLPQEYQNRLLSLKSMGSVALILALQQRLSEQGIYWHNLPKAAGFPFLSMVEHTNFVSPEFFGDDHIVYCGDYLRPDHEYFSLTKNELLNRFLPALSQFNPQFGPDWVRDSWLFRTPYAQPVPLLHHSQAIPDLKTPLRGLWFASMSQVYPWDRGTNYAVQIARQAAQSMINEPHCK